MKSKIFERIGRKWKGSIDKVKEYEIVDKEENFESGSIPSNILNFEYQRAQRLKYKLFEECNGKSFEEVINGEELRNQKGSCCHILNQYEINLPEPDKSKRRILSDLKLIYGIGEVTERALKEEGYKTIEDLVYHPRFGKNAKEFLKLLEKCNINGIINWIGRWYSKSHPLMLYVSRFYNLEDFLFIDIETMGFFSRPIILFGIASISGERIFINQYLLRNISEESAGLISVLSHFKENIVLVTYNGKTFDIPYIKERAAYYQIMANFENPNFDLLYFARHIWRENYLTSD
jgi:hypothetical protein